MAAEVAPPTEGKTLLISKFRLTKMFLTYVDSIGTEQTATNCLAIATSDSYCLAAEVARSLVLQIIFLKKELLSIFFELFLLNQYYKYPTKKDVNFYLDNFCKPRNTNYYFFKVVSNVG